MSRYKLLRYFCLLFALTFCFHGFSLDVSAASDNLIESNLLEWDKVEANSGDVSVVGSNDISGDFYYKLRVKGYLIEGTESSCYFASGGVYDLSKLTAGKSYTFSMDILSAAQMNYNASYFKNIFNGNASLFIGLAKNATSGNEVELVEGYYTVINYDNYLDYLGNNFTFTFEMPNVVNPAICIFYMGEVESSTLSMGANFGFRNIKLVDNKQAEEDGFFDRLFEFFHDLKWDLIGGACGGEGCNKSPHTSLADRIGTKLTELKESLSEKIEGLKQSFVDLGNSLIEGIKSLFVPREESINNWKSDIAQLLEEHLGIIYSSAALVTDLIEDVRDLVFNAPTTYSLTVPAVEFEIKDDKIHLWDDTPIDFSFLQQKPYSGYYSFYKVALYIFIAGLEIKYGIRVYRRMMAN